MTKEQQETIELAIVRMNDTIHNQFVQEVKRLVMSDGVDPDFINKGLVFGVALENIADLYLRGDRKGKDYKNLKKV